VKALFTLLAVTLSMPLWADPLADLDKFITEARTEYKVPGVSVVIVKDDKIVLAKGYGVRSIESDDKIDADTVFQLASVSKTFTAAGIALVVDQKKLDWDDEVITHMPEFVLKDNYATRYATSRDLLAHSTGLPAFQGDLLELVGFNANEVLRRIRYIEPAVSFRQKALYSNLGYFAAGMLIEKLMQKPFMDIIQEGFLSPLKMNRTSLVDRIKDNNVALPHAVVDGTLKVIPRNTSHLFVAAGGLCSTANDLGRWITMQINKGSFEGKPVLSPESVKTMHAPAMISEISFADLPPIDENSGLTFALGWTNYNYHGHVIIEKGGALDGVRSVITFIPELKLGIAVLANLNLTPLPELIRAKFLETYLGKSDQDIEKIFKEKAEFLPTLVAAPTKDKDVLPQARPLEKYAGKFHSKVYGDFNIVLQNQELVLFVGPAKYKGTIVPWGNDSLLLHWPYIDTGYQLLTYTFDPEGKPTQIQTDTLGILENSMQTKN
jgi:CubicO group peptidase (beta-lactamase class C family)